MSLRLLVLIAVLATGECFFGGAGKAPAKKVKATVKSKAPVKKAQTLFGKATTKAGFFDPSSDIGVVPPLGLFDPLNLISRGPDAYRRYQEIEIKHGRIAMLATLGVITTEAGFRLPGYISFSQDLKFSDIPGSLDGAYFGIPIAGWVQIAAFIAALDIAVFRQVCTAGLFLLSARHDGRSLSC